MKKNNLGFSLIELLAIVAILGIILLIAVPVVNNIVKDVRKKAFAKDAIEVVKSSQFLYDVAILKDKTFDQIVIDFDTKENVKLLNLKSTKKPNGTVIIKSDGEIVLSLYDGEFCATTQNNKVIVTNYVEEECGTRPNYPFITKWRVTDDNKTLVMPFNSSYNYDIKVDWGDNVIEAYQTHDVSHTYQEPGDYIIKIYGVMPYFVSEQNNTMIEIIDFGEVDVEKIQFGGSYDSYCASLEGTIPSPRTFSFRHVTSFEYLFNRCANLTGEIPEDLFKSAVDATDFRIAFSDAKGLTGSIPEDLFKYNTKADIFFWTFRNANGLTGPIPENLFKYNTEATSFRGTFYAMKGISGEIPENLFKYNTDVNTFENTFAYVTGLTGSIPEDLFRYNTKATIFKSTFLGASGLTGEIPNDLFKYNTDVTDFYQVFSNAKGLTGNAPKLWETHPNADGGRAFRYLTKLSNYNEIPDSWKQ